MTPEGAEATAAEQREAIRKGGEQIARWRASPLTFVREQFKVEPDAWQTEVLNAFPHNQLLAMVACKGPGKAQPKTTLMPTPTGTVAFERLKPGSEVFAGDGSVTRVRAVYDRGQLPVFKVVFDDGSETRACGEHLWKVRGRTERRHNTWSVLSTDQIIARGVREKNGKWSGRHFEIPRQGAVRISREEHQPIDPYVIGVWLGDGVRLAGRYATKPTPEIEHEIQRRGYETSGEKDGVVTVYGIAEQLRGLGVLSHYSYERIVPRCYLAGSVDQRTDLICGLMDTDGGIDDDGHMEFSSTSVILAEQVVWLARSLGGVAYIKETIKKPFYYGPNREKIAGRDCYRVTVRLPFNPFRVPHRRSRWTDPARSPSTLRYMTRKIDRIEPDGEADCMCIEVDHPDQTYLTNDFIVTHNTTVEAWLNWNFLATRPYPKMAATSISGDNLRDNLWAEMAKWRDRSPMLKNEFEWTKSRIYNRKAEETWFLSARTWPQSADPQKQADTLAGLHADYIMFTLDESGGIPDAVMVAAEAALSSCIEGHILQAGNPTQLSGPLYRANRSRKERGGLWFVINITGDPDDPLRSPRVSVVWAKNQIATHGRDNPWVLVNVFGQFPPSSFNSLIGVDEVREAMKRLYRDWDYRDAARVLGVDVARYGHAASVIYKRQGLQSFPMRKVRGVNSIQGAGLVARTWDDWDADAAFVDATGGFGAGWIDQLIVLGKAPIGIQFSSEAHEKSKYYNKRAEMAFDAVQWIKRGGALIESEELLRTLTETTYTFQKDRILLEPKEDIEARLGFTLDEFDGLILTFAEPVSPKGRTLAKPKHTAAYDPLSQERISQDMGLASAISASYDPFNQR